MLQKTKKTFGSGMQIFSKLALGLACLSLLPAISLPIQTQAAPVYSCPAPYTLQANNTCTNLTTKVNTVMHVSQCEATDFANVITRISLDNNNTPRNVCESIRNEKERQTLDIGVNNRYLGYGFCETVSTGYSKTITRFNVGNTNPLANPCTGDPNYNPIPASGEQPHTEDLYINRYMHISQCADIGVYYNSIITRVTLTNDPALTNNCIGDNVRTQIESPLTIDVGFPNIPATISSYSIESSNVGTGTCGTNNTVAQGSTINCTFPLTGASNGVYTIPASGLYGGVLKVNSVITNESNYYGPSSACTVSGSILTCLNLPVAADATLGNHEVVLLEPNVSWYSNKGSVNVTSQIVISGATEITSSNTSDGTCTPTEIRIGDLTACSYPLNGNPMNNEYKLPTTGVTAKISTATGNSAPCQIFNNGTINAALVCANIPSLGGTIGNQTVQLNLIGETNSAPIKLLAANTGTVVTESNTGNGKCTPSTVTIGNVILCDFALSGSLDNTYVLPTSGIKTKITTATSSSNPCQISNNGTSTASITCTQVPTSGATPGTQAARLDLPNESNFTSVTLVASTTTLGTNPQGELNGKVGSLVTGFITTTGATYSGPATYTNGNNCNISGVVSLGIFTPIEGTLVPMDCPTGSLSSGIITAIGNIDLGGIKSNFAKTELTVDDLKKIDIVCNSGQPVTVNSTTTCKFKLPNNKTLPKNLFFGVGDAKPAGNCTVKDQMATCTTIPTGSKTGIQSLRSQINGGTIFDTGKKITVNPSLSLAKTGNNVSLFLGLLTLVAITFSISFTGTIQLAKQKK